MFTSILDLLEPSSLCCTSAVVAPSVCKLLDAGLLVYVVYTIIQCVVLQPEQYYSVYDSNNWARARWFLLKRLGLAQGQSSSFSLGADFAIFNSTHISNVPGGSNRWRLPQDTSGNVLL